MVRGVFVTGTDTAVGKTVAAAALLHRYRSLAPVRYWKPIQTGIEEDDDTATVRRLGLCRDGEVLDRGIRLQRPLSPHLSAKLAGRSIQLQPLIDEIQVEPASDRWVVEGAGGVLVPINDRDLMVDLMSRLALPVVVVSRTKLGTINQTLLTLEALRSRALTIAGVVLVGEAAYGTREAIETYGGVRVLGELPWLTPLTGEALRDWASTDLDPAGHLAELWGAV